MILTLDRRADLAGRPAAHALVVGISRYPYLPLKSVAGECPAELTSVNFAARSASIFAQWLVKHSDQLTVPLASCRVLFAPSEQEVNECPLAGPCGVSDFIAAASAWRRDALEYPDGVLIFYFAGHALELARAQPALVLADFGDDVGPALRATVSLSNLLEGLAPSEWQPNLARQQFFFIDTDRISTDALPLASLWRTTDVFDVPRASTFDDRRACTLYGTAPGGVAYADNFRTYFNVALMTCLDGAAAESGPPDPAGGTTVWRITTRSLVRGLQEELDRLSHEAQIDENERQRVAWSVQGDDAVIVRVDKSPEVEMRLRVTPPQLLSLVHIEVRNDRLETVISRPFGSKSSPGPDLGEPIVLKVPAGLYQVRVSLGDGAAKRSWETIVSAAAPHVELIADFKA